MSFSLFSLSSHNHQKSATYVTSTRIHSILNCLSLIVLHQKQQRQRGPGDLGYVADAPGDDRPASGLGVSWADLGEAMPPTVTADLPATTPGGYLAVERARAEAEAVALRIYQQGGVPPGAASGAAGTMNLHHDPRLRLPHRSIMGQLPSQVVGHGYGGQLEMTPHFPALIDSSAMRLPSVWGHGGTSVLMAPPAHDELQLQPQQKSQESQQQHINFALQQLKPAGLGSQRIVGLSGQHMMNSAGGLGLGHFDGNPALGTPTGARSQPMSPVAHFPSMAPQGMVVSLGKGGHSQQTNASTSGMVMFPSGSMGGAKRLPASNEGAGHALGVVGPWQVHSPWSEQLVAPWQHTGIPPAPGPPPQQLQQHHPHHHQQQKHQQQQQQQQQQNHRKQQQQQLQQMISVHGAYQGYHPSALDPMETQGVGLAPGVTLSSTKAQTSAARSPFSPRSPHDFEVPADHSTGLGSSLGLGLGIAGQLQAAPEESPQTLVSQALGIGCIQGAASPQEMRQPKRENGVVANNRARMVQRGPAPISGSMEVAGGSSYKGGGYGVGTSVVGGKTSPNSSFTPFSLPSFLPGFGGSTPPESPRSSLVGGGPYPTHLGPVMRGAEGGETKLTRTSCSSLPSMARNGRCVRGAGGREGMPVPPSGGAVSSSPNHQVSCPPPAMQQPLHYGGASLVARPRAEGAKAKRCLELSSQAAASVRAGGAGTSVCEGRTGGR